MQSRDLPASAVPTEPAGGARAAAAAKTYVLVHGAWHGGWCWRRVSPVLSGHGHQVFSPTQTGLGDRAHLLTRDVGVETFIQDIAGLIEMEDLSDVILVGHSFGGNIVSCVADRMRERIAHLVYLDAVIPTDGQNSFAFLPPAIAAERIQLSMQTSNGLSLPVPKPEILGVSDPADIAWLLRHMRPHPLKTYTDPIRLNRPPGDGCAVTYIACVDPAYPLLAYAHEYAKKAGWNYAEISTGHDAMVTAAERLAQLLLAVA